jgi:hypothetical protein
VQGHSAYVDVYTDAPSAQIRDSLYINIG